MPLAAGTLRVFLQGGTVPDADILGHSDTFVQFRIPGVTNYITSNTIADTGSPTWNKWYNLPSHDIGPKVMHKNSEVELVQLRRSSSNKEQRNMPSCSCHQRFFLAVFLSRVKFRSKFGRKRLSSTTSTYVLASSSFIQP